LESVLRLLKGPDSLAMIDDDVGEYEGDEGLDRAAPESSDEFEEI